MIPELENCKLDHIAIAVNDIEDSVIKYSHLGLNFSDSREVVESQKVKTAFCHVDENAHIELLQAPDSESSIQKFIDKNGEGIHHLCFRVKDVVQKQAELTGKGFRFIYPEAVTGANNCLVNFIHPKSMNGVLVEISQKA
jgi:methylmalonyl-CoA/ethylmalonyl-CoA epimerase